MMTITCPKCAAHYDVDPALIPPSGIMMRCPACLHTFAVQPEAPEVPVVLEESFTPPGGVAAPELPSPKGPITNPPPAKQQAPDLPVPKRAPKVPTAPPPPPAPSEDEPMLLLDSLPPPPRAAVPSLGAEADLPAPVAPGSPGAQGQGQNHKKIPAAPDLPAPVLKSKGGISDLPAPVGAPVAKADLPAPLASRKPDLPAPVASRKPDLPAPVPPKKADLPTLKVDLPAPKQDLSPRKAELPAPVRGDLPAPLKADLPMPVSASLPAPVAAGLPSPVQAELPMPQSAALPAVAQAALPEPVHPEEDDLSLDGVDLPPPPLAAANPGASGEEETQAADLPPEEPETTYTPVPDETPSEVPQMAEGAPVVVAVSADAEKRRRKKRIIRLAAVSAAGIALVSGIGGGAYFLLAGGGRSQKLQEQIDQATNLLFDDLHPSFRRAADGFADVAAKDEKDFDAFALEVQARLAAARFGDTSELKKADVVQKQLPQEGTPTPEMIKAKALKDLLSGRPKDAARALTPLTQGDAKKDPTVGIYLGWAELRGNNAQAAEKAFRMALTLRPKTVAALHGIAQAKELGKDRRAAYNAYGDVLKVMPGHFGAGFGKIRTGEDAAVEAPLTDLITKHKGNAAPRELADVWALLGQKALEQTRKQDAEERLRKALAADPSHVGAKVTLGRLLCDREKYDEAADLSRKVLKEEPKNLEAALNLARALISTKKPLDAGAPLTTAASLAPKDARVLYYQGLREEALAAKDSNTKAADFFKKAKEADPKYIDAYVALSRVLGKLGNADEARAVLEQVAGQAGDDPLMSAALGEAYLIMGEHKKAETALRAALEKKPEMNPVRLQLVAAQEALGQLAAAEVELSEIQKRTKAFPGLTERRARLLYKMERYPEAETLYLQAAGEPGASLELRMLAAQLNAKSHPKEAQGLAEGVLRDQSRSPQAHALMAMIKLQQGQLGEALVAADMAARMGDSGEANLARAMVLQAQNRRPDAVAALGAARKPPVEGRAMVLHAKAVFEDNKVAEAYTEINDFLNRSKELLKDRTVYRPEEVTELITSGFILLGDIETHAQREERAIKAYEQAARVSPKSGEVAARLGRAFYNRGKRGPAIKELSRALQIGGEASPYALESYLLLGDSYRESKKRADALRAYQKWLALAPQNAPERREVERHVQAIGDGRSR